MPHAEERLIHDLRNAASVIRGAAVQLHEARDVLDAETSEQLTEMIVRRSEVLVRLVDDLSILQQVGRGDLRVSLQPVDLAPLCRDAVGGLRGAEGRELTVDVATDTVALADPLRITQVLDNLLGNALRYGGPQVTLTAHRDGATVRLVVADDGSGVPPDLVDTLFEVYARGPQSDRYGGSGLGLAIVQELCAALGGHVEYDGSHGARFTVVVPALVRRDVPVPQPDGSHGLVLYDGPEQLVGLLVGHTLAGLDRGEAVVVAASPQQLSRARELLEDRGVPTHSLVASGQLVPLDAAELHDVLVADGHLDERRLQAHVGTVLERVAARWRHVRALGTVSGLYWVEGRTGLALELERAWLRLVERLGATATCLYPAEAGTGGLPEQLRHHHDAVAAG